MYKHHSDSIRNVTEKLKKRQEVKAIILVGTIAQGFEDASSDIDLLIVLDEEEFQKRRDEKKVLFFDKESVTYEGGYIDGKYISLEYIRQVSQRGSDAARYAFIGAKILYSQIDGLNSLLEAAIRYPVEEKNKRIELFCCHMIAWCWYANEALRENNWYLISSSIPNIALFAGRAILALNETLYPYHKWFTKVLRETAVKPPELLMQISAMISNPSKEKIDELETTVLDFLGLDKRKLNWADNFILQSEMNWLYVSTPISDI